jgi:hypothetical protein
MAEEAFILSYFGVLVGSPSFLGWLTEALEKRLQTIVGTHLMEFYKSSSHRLKMAPYRFTYIPWHMRLQ